MSLPAPETMRVLLDAGARIEEKDLGADDDGAVLEQKLADLEEIAFRLGYIDRDQVERLAASMMKNQYGQYLMDMLNETNTLRTRP